MQSVQVGGCGFGHVLGRAGIERGAIASAAAEAKGVQAEDALFETVGQHPAAVFQQVGGRRFGCAVDNVGVDFLLDLPRPESAHQDHLVVVLEYAVGRAEVGTLYHHVGQAAVVVAPAETGIGRAVEVQVGGSRKFEPVGLVHAHDELVVHIAGAEHQHRRVFEGEGGVGKELGGFLAWHGRRRA